MKSREERREHAKLTLLFSAMSFGVMFITLLLTAIAVYFLGSTGTLIGPPQQPSYLLRVLISMFVLSNIIGLVVSYFAGKIPLRPLELAIDRINQLADGDFKVRLEYEEPFSRHRDFRNLSGSFNKLAEELDSTEMLRSDFINNFSHEFKTPIVSITGFAKLLKRGNLTEPQKLEYLDIIEKESLRLSNMATNVLNLTRVENQTILTDTSTFNLSEQLRDCILLLVDKWEEKNLEIRADFSEYEITANQELLKQVWVNLIDNAVKFSPENGIVEFTIRQQKGILSVSILNSGETIPPEKLNRIFNKFYQADESHATFGNGIGLAIVKKVIELHGGEVSVRSENNITMFTVELPAER